MRVYQLLHELVSRFVPIDDSSKNELASASIKQYNGFRDSATVKRANNAAAVIWNAEHKNDEGFKPKEIVEITWHDKIIEFVETPLARYIISIAFVWLVPVIASYMHGGQQDEELTPEEEFEEYQSFKRMKNRLK